MNVVRDKAMVVLMRLETRGQYSGQDGCTDETSTAAWRVVLVRPE